MSTTEITSKIDALKELEALIEEAKAEAETLRDEIKTEMLSRNTEEMEAGQYIVRWTSVLSQRFDSTAFKKGYAGYLQGLHQTGIQPPLLYRIRKRPCQSGNSDKGNPRKTVTSFRGTLIISLCPSKIKEENTVKQLTSYNRVAGYLNKVFDLLNAEFFENALSRPTITIQSTPKAYGHFSLREDTWISTLGGTHEINIGAGTLSRPIEEVCATLLHEMVHYHNYVNGIQDCSRGGTYHNRRFRDSAQAHGLIVQHNDKYGWTITSPSDALLQFCLDNDLGDILINRNEYGGCRATGTGTHAPAPPPVRAKTSSARKYICPCCGNSVRATKTVNIGCMDCAEQMVLAG